MNKEIQASVTRLNERLNRPAMAYIRVKGNTKGRLPLVPQAGHIMADHNTIYGGYRLDEMAERGGVTGFAHNNGMESRMEYKVFKAYLKGIHDALDLA